LLGLLFHPEEGGSTFLEDVFEFPPYEMASQELVLSNVDFLYLSQEILCFVTEWIFTLREEIRLCHHDKQSSEWCRVCL
jgi:hypothetical protein